MKLSDSWTSLDKGQHFVASMIGTILVSKINNSYFKLDNLNSKKIDIFKYKFSRDEIFGVPKIKKP